MGPVAAGHAAQRTRYANHSSHGRTFWDIPSRTSNTSHSIHHFSSPSPTGVCLGSLWALDGLLAELVITVSCIDLPPSGQPSTRALSMGNWGSAASTTIAQCTCRGACTCGRVHGVYFSGVCACVCVEELLGKPGDVVDCVAPDLLAAHERHVIACCAQDVRDEAAVPGGATGSPGKRGNDAIKSTDVDAVKSLRSADSVKHTHKETTENSDANLAASMCSSLEASWDACACACAAVNASQNPKSIHVCGCPCHHHPAPHAFKRSGFDDCGEAGGEAASFGADVRMRSSPCDVWLPLAYNPPQNQATIGNGVGRKPVTMRLVLPAFTMFFLYRMQMDLSMIETMQLIMRSTGKNKAVMDPWWLMACPGPAIKLSVYDYNL